MENKIEKELHKILDIIFTNRNSFVYKDLDGDNGGGHNSASAYLTGVTYSTEVPGTPNSKITFVVPQDAPSTLYYYNINTSGITGTITVFDDEAGSNYLLLESANVYATVVGQNFG